MPELVPANPLEQALENVRAGVLELADFLHTLIYAEIVVPTGTEPQPDGSGFTPMLFEKNGIELVAAYSAKERVPLIDGQFPSCLLIRGGDFLRRMSAGYGLVINPGWSLGMEMSPEGIRQIIDNMAEPVFDT